MPYIRPEEREKVVPATGHLDIASAVNNPGNLNFAFTKLVQAFIDQHGLSYATINTIVGAMECSKIEAYRRVAAPYEDTKVSENGDVWSTAHRSVAMPDDQEGR